MMMASVLHISSNYLRFSLLCELSISCALNFYSSLGLCFLYTPRYTFQLFVGKLVCSNVSNVHGSYNCYFSTVLVINATF